MTRRIKADASPPNPSARLGRRRLPETTDRVLRATLSLGQSIGFEKLTVEAIADRAGVAKTTIYRRWPKVGSIVMDAFLGEVNRHSPIRTTSETARECFRVSMRSLATAYRGRIGKLLRSIVGYAQLDADLRDAVRQRWVEPRRQIARSIVVDGIARGELRGDLDPDIVLDALYGPLYHRLLVPYDSGPISAAYIDALVDMVFDGLRPRDT